MSLLIKGKVFWEMHKEAIMNWQYSLTIGGMNIRPKEVQYFWDINTPFVGTEIVGEQKISIDENSVGSHY